MRRFMLHLLSSACSYSAGRAGDFCLSRPNRQVGDEILDLLTRSLAQSLLRFVVLEPKQLAGRLITGRVYCTPKSLWKLNWTIALRGLDRQLIRSLALDSTWVERHENVFVVGPTGVGKSFSACALVQKACRNDLLFYTWPVQAASMCWWWTTGPWLRWQKANGATSGKLSAFIGHHLLSNARWVLIL